MANKKKPIIETHGKVEEPPKFQPTLLEQIWGDDNMTRYGTLDEEAYAKQVNEMTRSDLEAHARKVGVIIVESSIRLREKLLGEFRSYLHLVRRPVTPPSPHVVLNDAAKKVLAEGR